MTFIMKFKDYDCSFSPKALTPTSSNSLRHISPHTQAYAASEALQQSTNQVTTSQ